MAPFVLLLSATKIIGVAGVILISVDSLLYRSFRKKNLLPFDSPIDEEEEVVARFAIDKDVDDGGFFFALATAPAHVEDKLRDAWLEFAKEDELKDAKATGEPDIRTEVAETTPGSISLLEELEAAKIHKASGSSAGVKENQESKESSQLGSSPPPEIAEVASGRSSEQVVHAGQKNAGEGGSPNTPNSGVTDPWTLVSDSSDNDRADDSRGSLQLTQKGTEANVEEKEEEVLDTEGAPDMDEPPKGSTRRKGKSTTAATVFNPPRKIKQFGKVAIEAVIRGIDKVSEAIDDIGEESFNVAAWQNAYHPEERLRFWTEPDTELKLAQEANVSVFRMGVDWSRIMPVEPVDGIEAVKWDAVRQYRKIIEKVRSYGMKVMLTLFHHSLPVWAAKFGGWKNEKTTKYFVQFTRVVVEQYADLVDYWITFNEPHVFAMLTYCAGAWPGGDPNLLETATAVLPKGVFKVVMASMADSHNQAYDIIHDISKSKLSKKARVGVAHHVSFMRPYGLPDVPPVMLSDWMTRFAFIDDIVKKLDYIGINYYGQEVVSLPGLKHVQTDEYSESGRGVYPDGLFRVLVSFHERYKKYGIPYIITENGVSDSSDYIRRPYITEHLLAVRAAMAKGIPVQGYCFWTTSDNWEWADGYGPKFGLVAVDRHNNLARTPRPSYYLFGEIARTGIVTKQQRDQAWDELQTAAAEGKKRPFCRSVDSHGLMYSGGLDVPIELPFAQRDWRFGHYEMEGLQDPLSRFVRFILSGAFLGRKKGGNKKIRPPSPVPSSPHGRVPELKSKEVEEAVPAFA